MPHISFNWNSLFTVKALEFCEHLRLNDIEPLNVTYSNICILYSVNYSQLNSLTLSQTVLVKLSFSPVI